MDLPLKLTPSLERNFRTQITSQVEYERPEESEKSGAGDWRRYISRAKDEEAMHSSSWSSRTGFGGRIVQTREITQEVEVVTPHESRWTIAKPRRLSRGP
jgi:sarcosine oxidase delta subunit